MSGKHKNWHREWSREGSFLVHTSGLRLEVIEGDGFTDIETDDASLKGYLKEGKYSQYDAYTLNANGDKVYSRADVPAFDQGAEKGFMGLNMHGNMHISGDLKIFSYNCTGTGTSRC